jgi:hypothetical protein
MLERVSKPKTKSEDGNGELRLVQGRPVSLSLLETSAKREAGSAANARGVALR